jgi:hypothetical protein
MNYKVITVVDQEHRAKDLIDSLRHFGWDYHVIQASWQGFGTKLNQLNDYLHANQEIENFIFLDGYDCLALAGPKEFKPIYPCLISTEVNCWPDVSEEPNYPKVRTKWRFANSGSYYMASKLFKELMEREPVKNEDDDQRWMTRQVLNQNLILDYKRSVFQTLCGIVPDEDFMLTNDRLLTNEGTKPIFLHGNGKANMEIYKSLIKY